MQALIMPVMMISTLKQLTSYLLRQHLWTKTCFVFIKSLYKLSYCLLWLRLPHIRSLFTYEWILCHTHILSGIRILRRHTRLEIQLIQLGAILFHHIETTISRRWESMCECLVLDVFFDELSGWFILDLGWGSESLERFINLNLFRFFLNPYIFEIVINFTIVSDIWNNRWRIKHQILVWKANMWTQTVVSVVSGVETLVLVYQWQAISSLMSCCLCTHTVYSTLKTHRLCRHSFKLVVVISEGRTLLFFQFCWWSIFAVAHRFHYFHLIFLLVLIIIVDIASGLWQFCSKLAHVVVYGCSIRWFGVCVILLFGMIILVVNAFLLDF